MVTDSTRSGAANVLRDPQVLRQGHRNKRASDACRCSGGRTRGACFADAGALDSGATSAKCSPDAAGDALLTAVVAVVVSLAVSPFAGRSNGASCDETLFSGRRVQGTCRNASVVSRGPSTPSGAR